MTAYEWTIIIGAIFLGLTNLLGMLLSYLRSVAVANKVETVRTDLAANTDMTNMVVHQTNGMAAELRAAHAKIVALEEQLREHGR